MPWSMIRASTVSPSASYTRPSNGVSPAGWACSNASAVRNRVATRRSGRTSATRNSPGWPAIRFQVTPRSRWWIARVVPAGPKTSTGASGRAKLSRRKRVEAGDVVDVQVGEEQGVDGPDLGGRERGEAALAAVEQQPVRRLAGPDAGQQRVVAARLAEDLVLDAHATSTPSGRMRDQPPTSRQRRCPRTRPDPGAGQLGGPGWGAHAGPELGALQSDSRVCARHGASPNGTSRATRKMSSGGSPRRMRLTRSTGNRTGCQPRRSSSSSRSRAGRPRTWPTLRCGRNRRHGGLGAGPSQAESHSASWSPDRASSGSGRSQTV